MKKYILPTLVLASLFIASCTKTIDFKEGDTDQKIVVNSIMCPDSTFKVRITKSQSVLRDFYFEVVTNAQVSLLEDGNKVGQAKEESGYYQIADFKPQAGKNYQLEVIAGDKIITAETNIPNPVEIIETDTSTIENDWGNRSLDLKIKFRDSPNEDYYRISVSREYLYRYKYDYDSSTYILQNSPVYIYPDDPVFTNLYSNFGGDEMDMGPGNDYNIFSDDFFNGKNYSIHLKLNSSFYANDNMIYEKYIIHFQKLSKDMFYFLKYLNLYDYYRDDPFSEPVQVYSNVIEGAGIVAGFDDSSPLVLEKIYQPFSMDTIQPETSGYGGGYHY